MAQWHNAGPDVKMTIQLVEFYFQRMMNAPTKGKITAYFTAMYAEEALGMISDQESEGDWESNMDDDGDSDLSNDGSDFGDEAWDMTEEECEMKDDSMNAAASQQQL